MSLPEIGFRTIQYLQKHKEKKGVSIPHENQDYNQIFLTALTPPLNNIPSAYTKEFCNYDTFDFFGYSINIYNEIDWHLDISTGKSFPQTFSKDINIRSDHFGNAKLVWEINRLQFLLPLAIKYIHTKDINVLTRWMQLMKSWVKNNKYLYGVNWYSNIEINIRLIVWHHCWQVFLEDENLIKNHTFSKFVKDVWLPCIYEHCIYSFSNPSKYSSANNHLVAEYAGLFIASTNWKFAESDKWQNYSLRGLEKEIKLQYSENGINREEAAEYIQFITDFFLISYAVGTRNRIAFTGTYRKYLYNISSYIKNLLDIKNNYRKYGDEDDGKVLITSTDPHFNNFSSILSSAAVIFNETIFKLQGNKFDLKNWMLWGEDGKEKFEKLNVETAPLKTIFYKKEGHFLFKKSDSTDINLETYLHFDAAPLGFLSIAAHGHADALSIALHVDGFPVIADIGTYTYHTEKRWRNYFISTLGHNTICIDNLNQALQAGPTMWLNHYKVNVVDVNLGTSLESVSAEHTGYNNIGCQHQRTVEFNRECDSFLIIDRITVNNKLHILIQPWHIHPQIVLHNINEHVFILQHPFGPRAVKISLDKQLRVDAVKGQLEPKLGWYSDSFLKKEPTTSIKGIVQTNKSQEIILYTKIEIFKQ